MVRKGGFVEVMWLGRQGFVEVMLLDMVSLWR